MLYILYIHLMRTVIFQEMFARGEGGQNGFVGTRGSPPKELYIYIYIRGWTLISTNNVYKQQHVQLHVYTNLTILISVYFIKVFVKSTVQVITRQFYNKRLQTVSVLNQSPRPQPNFQLLPNVCPCRYKSLQRHVN